MKPASARRISSHADGPDVARARGRPATSAPNGPISSARSVPRRGKRRAGHALVRHRRHGGAPHRDQCRRRSRRPCGADRRSGRLALDAQAGDPRQHHRPGAAATIARVEPGGKCLAIHARQLVLEPVFKSYEAIVALCCQAWNKLIDTAMKDHVPRHAKMGAWVLINDRWYKPICSEYHSWRARPGSAPGPNTG